MTEPAEGPGRLSGRVHALVGGGLTHVAYDVATPLWTAPALDIAVLSDLHAISPWTPPELVSAAVARVMALRPDLILLPGDFIAERILPGRRLPATEIAALLAPLAAPRGVFAVLGNHDWKDCPEARANGYAASSVTPALEAVGIPVLSNTARPLGHGDAWLVGMDSQRGHLKFGEGGGRHDPDAAFAPVPADAPAILMAHEPDYFRTGTRHGALQVSGHTHGGQMALAGRRPFAPVEQGDDLAYGHVAAGDRHVVVSGGLGYSGFPLRLNQPPEITSIRLRHG